MKSDFMKPPHIETSDFFNINDEIPDAETPDHKNMFS